MSNTITKIALLCVIVASASVLAIANAQAELTHKHAVFFMKQGNLRGTSLATFCAFKTISRSVGFSVFAVAERVSNFADGYHSCSGEFVQQNMQGQTHLQVYSLSTCTAVSQGELSNLCR